ncbi:MAG: lipopolysaccharide heptosyltransferase II [Vicinamibacterales bacterium]
MPERIVVLAPNWLGDVVMAEPAVAALRRAHPAAHLAVAARASVAGVLAFVPGVDEVVTFPAGATTRVEAARLAAGRFDTAVLLPNSFRSAWVARRAGIRRRAGFRGDGRSWLLTDAVERPTASRPAVAVRQIDYYLALTTALGWVAGASVPRLLLTPAARAEAEAALAAHGITPESPFVVLAPGAAGGPAKQWVPGHAARLVERLVAGGTVRVVVVGAAADRPVAAEVVGSLAPAARAGVVDLVGQTSLVALAGLLARARAVVANDSGALHLAAALGAPVAAVFGPTDERLTAPTAADPARVAVLTHHVWCRPCGLRTCPIDHSCMTGVTPERVFAAVEAWL